MVNVKRVAYIVLVPALLNFLSITPAWSSYSYSDRDSLKLIDGDSPSHVKRDRQSNENFLKTKAELEKLMDRNMRTQKNKGILDETDHSDQRRLGGTDAAAEKTVTTVLPETATPSPAQQQSSAQTLAAPAPEAQPLNVSAESSSLAVPAAASAPIPGDVNQDGSVDGQDLTMVSSNWGLKSADAGFNANVDANHDGIINGQDIAVIASHWGAHQPPPGAILVDQTWIQNNMRLDNTGHNVLVLNQAGKMYQFQTDFTAEGSAIYIAASNVTIDLNGHTIKYGSNNAANSHGVILYLGWDNTQPWGDGSSDNAKIINGSIVDQGTGATSHAIYGRQSHGTIVDNMQITANGTDSATIFVAEQSTTITITNSVLTDLTEDTTNRFAGPANVWCQHGLVVASGNILVGGNAGFNVGDDSQITKNLISQSNFATNGYALFNFGSCNILFADNLILPVGAHGGPGVIINGAYNDPALNNIIKDNVILNSDAPNTEYPGGLNAAAIRVRYTTDGNVFTGNTSLGLAGDPFTGASGLSLSDDGSAGVNTFANNNFSVLLAGTPTDDKFYASALTPAGQGSGDPSNPADANLPEPSYDIIKNNSFQSNDILIRLSNNLGGNALQAAPLTGNSFSWTDGHTAYTNFMAAVNAKLALMGMSTNAKAISIVNAADALIASHWSAVPLSPQRATWYTHYYSDEKSNPDNIITLLDTTWGAGVDPRNFTYHDTSWSLGDVSARVGVSRQAHLVSAGGSVLANTTFTLTTDQGDVYTLKTDASGNVSIPVIQFGIDKASPVGAPTVVHDRTASTINVNGKLLTFSEASLLAQTGVFTITLS